MAVALLRFPYLVYDKILKKLSLNDRCALATLSKRTRWIVKRSFEKQTFQLRIWYTTSYFITADNGNKFSFYLRKSFLEYLKDYIILRNVLIPLEDQGMSSHEALAKHYDLYKFTANMTQFLIDTFPNLTITIPSSDVDIQSSLEVISRSNLKIDELSVKCANQKETQDILSNCGTVKKLYIDGDLQHPTAILPALQCDDVQFKGTRCCAEQIVQVFMNCKRFNCSPRLQRFNATSLVLILEAWKNNSRLEYLELNCKRGAYQIVTKKMQGTPKKFKYQNEVLDCYLVRQLSGKEAVIYSPDSKAIELTTDFELVGDQ